MLSNKRFVRTIVLSFVVVVAQLPNSDGLAASQFKESKYFWGSYCQIRGAVRICENFDYSAYENVSIVLNYGNLTKISPGGSICLQNCKLPQLPDNYFDGFPNVENMTVRNCEMKRLDVDTFKPKKAKLLTHIDFSRNRLEQIPVGIFSALSELTTLNLSSNRIDSVDTDTFTGLAKLNVLDLGRNSIEMIESKAFEMMRNLTHLCLSENRIRVLAGNTLEKNFNLTELDLSSNLMLSVDEVLFGNLKRLKILNLSGNQIESLNPLTLQSMTQLQVLNLNDNQLKHLSTTHFSDMRDLVELHIRNNLLEQFASEDVFTDFDSLEILDLSGGLLKQRTHESNQSDDGLSLKLNLNAIKLNALKHLNLSSSGITFRTINKYWYTHSLEVLDLSYNNLTEFQIEILYPLRHLKELYIQGNNISKFDFYDDIVIKRLTRIALIGNRFGCDELRAMIRYFHSNNIHCIPEHWYVPKSAKSVIGIECYSADADVMPSEKNSTETDVDQTADYDESPDASDSNIRTDSNSDYAVLFDPDYEAAAAARPSKLATKTGADSNRNRKNLVVNVKSSTDLHSFTTVLSVVLVLNLCLVAVILYWMYPMMKNRSATMFGTTMRRNDFCQLNES